MQTDLILLSIGIIAATFTLLQTFTGYWLVLYFVNRRKPNALDYLDRAGRQFGFSLVATAIVTALACLIIFY